jgi:hypothetical protein
LVVEAIDIDHRAVKDTKEVDLDGVMSLDVKPNGAVGLTGLSGRKPEVSAAFDGI